LWELRGFLASAHVGGSGYEKEVGVGRDGRIGERTVMDFMELYVHEREGGAIVKPGGWSYCACKDLLPLKSGHFS